MSVGATATKYNALLCLTDLQDSGYNVLRNHMSTIAQEPLLTSSSNKTQQFHLSRSPLIIFQLTRAVLLQFAFLFTFPVMACITIVLYYFVLMLIN